MMVSIDGVHMVVSSCYPTYAKVRRFYPLDNDVVADKRLIPASTGCQYIVSTYS